MIVIPGYSISTLLYHGSRTVVYQGTRNADSLPVVIKTLLPEYATPENSGRLKHEYEISKDLNLQGVVAVLALESYGGVPALIMEDFGGVPLKSRIPQGGMATGDFLRCAIQVAATLAELHALQIIHKDIKPSNIIVHPRTGLTKISDFGISSRLQQEYHSSVISDSFEGSIFYMSPEQTGRMNRAVDYRTDFYSLGVAFFELLTGQLPFRAEDQLEWVHCHIARPPQDPRVINGQIPEVLSAILAKLMAKTAEERYQSARGLLADLEQCLATSESSGLIPFFTPGRHDVSNRFQITQNLYGRDPETATLLSAFERVCDGGAELLLVTGFSGIGKSSLVREIHRPVVQHRGYFISGKFDQFQRDTPYLCLIQAFRELAGQILTESDEAIARWRQELLTALEGNARIITDIIPEIRQIIGEQPPLPELPSAESQNRFNHVFRQFIGVCARREHPLVLFADDLHWADTASIKLLQYIVCAAETRYLFLIGAYRDNEVDGAHPLMQAMEEVRQTGAALRTVSLNPLATTDIARLVAASFACSDREARPLAELLRTKTGGNPFFITELLKDLHDQGLLAFSGSSNRWHWDLQRIEQVSMADSMAELIAGKLRSLPEATLRTLGYGACIGSQFTLATLALVQQRTQDDIARDLWPALDGGFITTDGSFRIEGWDETGDSATCSFIHDGVQQASYALMDETRRRETHLKIGRQLLETATPEERDVRLFDIVNHLNDTRTLLDDPAERRMLAELNRQAGDKALASNAYDAALKYLAAGMELLPESPWQSAYELAGALHTRRLECELLCNNFEEAERLFDDCLNNLRTPVEKAAVYTTKIVLCGNLGRFNEAIHLGAEALEMFGVRLPLNPGKPAILLQYLTSRRLRARRKNEGYAAIADLSGLPEMTRQDRLAIMNILSNIGAPSYLHDKNLFALIAMMMVNLSLEHGNCAMSPVAYALYGMMIIAAFGEFDAGFEFGAMALRLNDQSGERTALGKTAFVFHNFIAHRKLPVSSGADALKDIYLDSLRGGDLIYAGYSLLARLLHLATSGIPLDTLLAEGDRSLDFLRRVQNSDALFFVRIVQQAALCLKGKTDGTTGLSDSGFDEAAQLALMKEKRAVVPLQGYYLYKTMVCCVMGDFDQALQNAGESEKLSDEALCQAYHADHFLYQSLAVAGAWHHLTWQSRLRYSALLKRNRKKLAVWARHCPENFLHTELLIAGILAGVKGNGGEACRLLEKAAVSALRHGFVHCEALALELAAKSYQAVGAEAAAQACFVKARDSFARWGASAKVRQLEERHPELCDSRHAEPSAREETTQTTGTSSAGGGETLDMMTVIKVSQAISGEVQLDRLLRRLLGFVIENAGATRGVLILKRDNQLFIEAEGSTGAECTVLMSQQVDNSATVPGSIINTVTRTAGHIVLDDAAASSRFGHDPYIMDARPKSVLCTPIINQGRLTGALYLENNLATGVFTTQRLKVLDLLSSQVAISIENARLYEGVRKASDELEEANRTLEQKVIERTLELSEEVEIRKVAEAAAEEANRVKSDFLNTVSHELRTPLTSVLGFARIIRKKLDDAILPVLKPEDAKAAKSLGQIREVTDIIITEGERLTVLIDDVLDLAKMEAGKVSWNMQQISLGEVINRAAVAVSSLLEQKQLTLIREIDPELPHVWGDRDRLIQVVINLLSNALKFTDRGTITIRAAVAFRNTLRCIRVDVTDTGIGISPEDQSTVFEKFRQVGDTLTDKPKGTGLGLPICREIIDHHGGSIDVESTPGCGSTFSFTLPVDTMGTEGNHEENSDR